MGSAMHRIEGKGSSAGMTLPQDLLLDVLQVVAPIASSRATTLAQACLILLRRPDFAERLEAT